MASVFREDCLPSSQLAVHQNAIVSTVNATLFPEYAQKLYNVLKLSGKLSL